MPHPNKSTQRHSNSGGTCKNAFLLICETLVLVSLKIYFVYHLLRYLYNIPQMNAGNFPMRLLEISELILSLAAVAGADCIWSNKASIRILVSGRYLESSEPEGQPRQSLFQGSPWPYLLFGHAIFGTSLYFAANVCPWTPEGLASCSLWDAFSRFFFVNILAVAQSYMAMTVYTILCINVQRRMAELSLELKGTTNVLSHRGLKSIHQRWERCCDYIEELNPTFLVFVYIWYCYLLVRAIYVIDCISSALDPSGGATISKQQMCVPFFELTYLVVLCVVSEKVRTTTLQPVESLQELTIARPTDEVHLHVEVQRFLYRIQKYSTMALWKLSTWTENAMKIFLVAIAGLLLLQDKRIRAKLC